MSNSNRKTGAPSSGTPSRTPKDTATCSTLEFQRLSCKGSERRSPSYLPTRSSTHSSRRSSPPETKRSLKERTLIGELLRLSLSPPLLARDTMSVFQDRMLKEELSHTDTLMSTTKTRMVTTSQSTPSPQETTNHAALSHPTPISLSTLYSDLNTDMHRPAQTLLSFGRHNSVISQMALKP